MKRNRKKKKQLRQNKKIVKNENKKLLNMKMGEEKGDRETELRKQIIQD